MRKFIGYEKGVNLGGWLSQCKHTKEHYENFITEKDFSELSSWGIDHIRIPIDYNLIESSDGAIIEEGMQYIQKAIDWCGKYDLNMVLDLHKTAGYSFDEGEKENGFFFDAELQERFYRLWECLTVRFAKYYERIAFELLNEVTDKSFCDAWNEISEKCIRRIRKYSSEVYILIGGYWNNSIEALQDLKIPYDDKIVYNFHCYEPLIFTHQGAYWIKDMPSDFRLKYPDTAESYSEKHKALGLRTDDILSNSDMGIVGNKIFDKLFAKAVAVAEERNVPLYCGEYGVINLADEESKIEWYKDINASFRKYGISRSAWSYKEMDFGLSDKGLINKLKLYL